MRVVGLVFFLLLTFTAEAQFYTTGADPWRMHWRQIENERYRLVYDSCAERLAQNIANFLDNEAPSITNSLHYTPKRIPILLHSRSSLSNGVVVWAPKRLEMYPNMMADDDNDLFYRHLTLHEYRHVTQMDALNVGFTKAMTYVFGQQFTGLVSGVYLPAWFMEGDAVVTETSLSEAGRGRKAAFTQEFRNAVMTQKVPRYDVAYFGSYKWELPDYYRMGYLTVSATRVNHGEDVWSKALNLSGRKSWSITPFNRSLRYSTGYGKVNLYKESIDFWREKWEEQDRSITPTPCTILSHKKEGKRVYENYISVKKYGDDLIALNTSPDHEDKIVRIDENGKEKKVVKPSYLDNYDFTLRGDTLLWSERRNHIRWENASKEIIMMYDFKNKKKHRVTKQENYISPDRYGTKITAIYTGNDLVQHLRVLDFEGTVLLDYEANNNEELSYPRWLDDNRIVLIYKTLYGKSVAIFDLNSKTIEPLIPFSRENIRHLIVDENKIFYTSDKTGIDNVFCIDIDRKIPERVTSSRFGAAWAYAENGKVFYSDLSSKGYDIVEVSGDCRATDNPYNPLKEVADKLSEQENRTARNDTILSPKSSKKYSRGNIFNVHSWDPALDIDAINTEIRPGLSIMSQNLRGTLLSSAGVYWDSDKEEFAFLRFDYTALYPKFSLTATYGWDKYDITGYILMGQGDNFASFTYVDFRDRQNIWKLKLAVYQPLTWNFSTWNIVLQPGVGAQFDQYAKIHYTFYPFTYFVITEQEQPTAPGLPGRQGQTQTQTQTQREYIYYDDPVNFEWSQSISNVNYFLQFSMMKRASTRDVGNPIGVSAFFRYRHSPWGEDVGNVVSLGATHYLRGFWRHHQFSFTAQMQWKKIPSSGYYFSDDISRARGWAKIANRKMDLMSLNYKLPIWNSDMTWGPVVHFKRFIFNAFYDYQHGKTYDYQQFKRQSVGGELTTESYWLRLPYSVKFGLRESYLIEQKSWKSDFLITVSFN